MGCFLKLFKPRQRVVVKVVLVLVELPGDTGFFVEIIDSLPLQWVAVYTLVVTTFIFDWLETSSWERHRLCREKEKVEVRHTRNLVVVNVHTSFVLLLWTTGYIDRSAYQSNAVGVCGGDLAFLYFMNPIIRCISTQLTHLIHVSSSPAVSNRILHRDILSFQVTPAPRGIFGDPMIIGAIIQRLLILLIAITTCNHTLNSIVPVSPLLAQVPGQQCISLIRLIGIDGSDIRVNGVKVWLLCSAYWYQTGLPSGLI